MPTFPYIFTFYSYKGGVGRSMALLNTAYALAGRGRHVLVIDFDLEAPGIGGFLTRKGEIDLAPSSSPSVGDIIDLLNAVKVAPTLDAIPPVSSFLRAIKPSKLQGIAPKLGKLGRLDVIVADQARAYWDRLSTLNLNAMHQSALLELSAKLWGYLKAQRFRCKPLGLEDEPPQETPYDFILVDSRTGVTETGGLCIGPLADRLVVVTGLNDQNVEGTLGFLKEAGIEPQPRHISDIEWDDVDPVIDGPREDGSPLGLGPKPTLIVCSPMPSGELALKKERLVELKSKLGEIALALSYHPQMALLETLFVRDFPRESLTREYYELTNLLMAQVRDHPLQLAPSAQEPASLISIEKLLRLASIDGDIGGLMLANQVDELKPYNDKGFFLLRRALATLEGSSQLNQAHILNRWGAVLAEQAARKQGAEAERLFGLASDKFVKALKVSPDDYRVLHNWGLALARQARKKDGEEADRFFRLANNKLTKASHLNPDSYEVMNSFGVALSMQAEKRQGAEADALFSRAVAHYEAALSKTPVYYEALSNWGNALAAQASRKQEPKKTELLREAKEKWKKAAYAMPSLPLGPAILAALDGDIDACIARLKDAMPGKTSSRPTEIAAEIKAEILQMPVFAETLEDPRFFRIFHDADVSKDAGQNASIVNDRKPRQAD
ncbi:MAG: hypothetical protein KAI47_06740 [Deltaproteobacteria bacterium]|nr:hypothetical protein [Deltaproteobacteria bacterium]